MPSYAIDRETMLVHQPPTPPRDASPHHHQSSPIAIPGTFPNGDIRKRVATMEYDRATWRMYNRILDYRLKSPPVMASHHLDACTSPNAHFKSLDTRRRTNDATGWEESDSSCDSLDEFPAYDEVFDLDM
jgi:hypothetical protein